MQHHMVKRAIGMNCLGDDETNRVALLKSRHYDESRVFLSETVCQCAATFSWSIGLCDTVKKSVMISRIQSIH
jgi:hypothetical protein